jgi:hypothetical protein
MQTASFNVSVGPNDNGPTMNRESFWSGSIVAAFAVVCIVWIIPEYGGQGATYGMPPQLLPSIAAWVMFVCCAIVTIRAGIGLYRSGEPVFGVIPWLKLWGSVWPFLYVIVSIFILSYFPLTYAGPFIIALMLWILGERRPAYLIGCSIAPALFLYFLSAHLMRIGIV